jgi:hypothetical protein
MLQKSHKKELRLGALSKVDKFEEEN